MRDQGPKKLSRLGISTGKRPALRFAVLLAGCLAPLASATSAAAALHVIPFPGTPDASPLSQVIFSSLRPSDIEAVTVTGSESGRHAGRLTTLPDSGGAAFVPTKPFKPGEHVKVVAKLGAPASGTASGAPGATVLRFSFTVGIATPWEGLTGGPERSPARGAAAGLKRSRTAAEPTQSFRSARGLHPPVVSVTSDRDTKSGDIFLTPVRTANPTSTQAGPMILDGRGRLLWFHPVHAFATNFQVQRYHGFPALTWWQRSKSVEGEDVIMGRSYRTIAVLRAGYGYVADIHEFQLTPEGTALIDAYVPVQANLTSVGGSSHGSLMDCVIQELDVKTGRVLWEWHALGHVPLKAAFAGTPKAGIPYDFFHLNSVQQLPNGNLLVSSRVTWSVYEIDKQTGNVIWTLGGKYSNFKLVPGAGFEWQHDAHLYPGGILTVFDDASDGNSQEESQSSGKTIKLDLTTMTASPLRQYDHSPPLVTGAEGSTQLLSNHDVFVGWGEQPDFSEYTAKGAQIFNGSFPFGISSYRAFRFVWSGQPRTRPSIALSKSNGSLKLYASWNGATRVASWRVLGGSRPDALHAVDRASRTGFETVITLHSPPRYVAVQALSTQGKVLRTSATRPAPR